ncbi:GNAT family N-acetyltransferase [Agrobacterium rubi]|uniref:GNAT family N-acetyltransferase n=1 Tax=Agrobacterium rubi TaxID=28099 RepID=A0ABX2JAC9_9HYPH|nr:GNAT family N-acetyltransferase [Agrobacterium rubi]NTE89381.1 GNAT family N-acetyltransferase [Agrobacterium rubi]NTF39517.1 GNAT family N-acetyltransferase [Agrobacterium rubi]
MERTKVTFYNIREAHRQDLPDLIELYQHLAEGDDAPDILLANDLFEQFHAYPGSEIFIGEVDGVLSASCTLVVVPNLTRGGKPYGLIENVVTHRAFRKRGFGRQILQFATDAAWIAGCYKVMLMTGSKKPETLNFYLGAGFSQTKTGFEKRRFIPHTE